MPLSLTFLGTSAANAYPEAWCSCDNCERARDLGGPSLRKRSAALMRDDLLLDLGPDIMAAAQMHGCPLTNVRYCLQTHAHADHLDPSHLLSRSPGYGVVGAPRLDLYASPATLQRLARTYARDLAGDRLSDPETLERLNLNLCPIEPWQTVELGPYQVLAVPANHEPAEACLLFAVRTTEDAVFYGTDTARLPEDVWQGLRLSGWCFDTVVLDHTYGPDEPGSDHLCAREVAEHVARMREEGLLSDRGRAFATHISHEGNPPHPELSVWASEHGYEIAHDGLTV